MGSLYPQIPSWGDPYLRPSKLSNSHSSLLGGLPGSEFMGSMESVLQVSSSHNILTPEAFRDHMDLLVKIHRLEVKVGSSVWRLEDLCQRAELPRTVGLHKFESLLARLIPCVVITPADCFWEGSKVLVPDGMVQIPWLSKQYTLRWPTLNPQQLLTNFQAECGNHSSDLTYLDEVTDLLSRAGMSHGYLTRPCLDPHDLECPSLAPNHKGQPPNVAHVVANGCPSFAANILHWPRDLILGGQKYSVRNQSTVSCHGDSTCPLVQASALQSLLLLRSPQDLYRTVLYNDPYKHESWNLRDAQNVLDQWRNGLKHLLLVHNKAISASQGWLYYGFTDNSIRDMLTQSTVRVWFAQLAGAAVLMLLYGMVCLLCWREPSRSQCWLALAGLGLIVLALVAGLGICSLIGIPFNVLSVQVLPFLILGLGMEGLFVLTTCNTCVLSRSSEVNQKGLQWTTHVLAEHGTSLVFSALSIASAFFAATYFPVPVMRQFCLQAGILVVVQAITLLILFPVLLKLDSKRRIRHRMDVLCCLRQPVSMAHTPSPPFLVSASSADESAMRVVEVASTKVRLSSNAVATVKVSVSTQKPPSSFRAAQSGDVNPGVIPLDCLCCSCQYRRLHHSGPILVRFANKLARALSRFFCLRLAVFVLGVAPFISAAVLSPMHLKLGLSILSLTPTDAIEHGFVDKSSKLFGLIHFQLVTRGNDAMPLDEISAEDFGHAKSTLPQESALLGPGVDFARSQARLRKLFFDVASIPGVSFTGERIWLDSMRDWLLGLQKAFDEDFQNQYITDKGNWSRKASENGVLGLLLIVQTDNGIDLDRIRTARLVRNHTIDPSAFRVYLHAWRVLDAFNYTAPPCTIIPDPGVQLSRITLPRRPGGPADLYSISPARPIQMVQTSFFATGYGDIADQINFVKKVRALTEQATSQGVPVFPTGLPFTLAEQYLDFWQYFCTASGILLGVILVAGFVFLPNPVATLLAVCVGGGGAVSACLLGFLILGLDLNAISGGLLLTSFGLGSKLASGILCGWYGPQHNIHRVRRVQGKIPGAAEEEEEGQQTMEEADPPLRVKKLFAVLRNQTSQIVHVNVSFVLAVALLAAVRVDFIADHFFRLTGMISFACLFNCLVLLPTVCYSLDPVFPSPLHTLLPSPSVHTHTNLETSVGSLSPPLPPSGLPRDDPADFNSFLSSRETEEEEEGEEEEDADLAMRQLCDSLRRSGTPPPASTVIDLFASALRGASRHASLSTISEEPSNSSSTISLHYPAPVITPPYPSAVRMKEFLPLLNAAMVAAQRHQQSRRGGEAPEPPPPPYSSVLERPPAASR
uniref:SSD domain-containing protein n=1 Tax=Mesocestoides corti TaxID=53468 RepID=A0A5K3EWG9_MESCO